MADDNDARDFYIAIEPSMVPNLEALLEEVDNRLVDYVDALQDAEDPEQRTQVLVELVNEICEIAGEEQRGFKNIFKKRNNGKIPVTPEEMTGLRYLVVREKLGMGPLEPLIVDPYIEDVSCSGVGPLFVEHKVFGGLKASVTFATHEELDRFVIRLSEKIGRPVTFREPIVDAVLPDGSRVNIVFGTDVSKRGSNFSIRKFSETPMSILDLIESGSLNYEMGAYLSFMMREGMNVLVSGETASGKTTLLNAVTTFINPNAKIVTIEDTPEVQVAHPNWTREVVRGSTK